jgi:hypothetical protein
MAVNLSFSNIVVLVLLLLQQWMMVLHQSWPVTTTTHFYDRPAGLSTPDSTLTDRVHKRNHEQLGGSFPDSTIHMDLSSRHFDILYCTSTFVAMDRRDNAMEVTVRS